MDGRQTELKKVSVAALYDRLASLDKKHEPKAAHWFNVLMRAAVILFVILSVLAPLIWLVKPSTAVYLIWIVGFLLLTILTLCAIAIVMILIGFIPRAWSPFKQHSRDLDERLSLERALIVDLRPYAVDELKEVATRIDVELKIATRRMNIFAVSVAITTISIAASSRIQAELPDMIDPSTFPIALALLALVSGVAALMMISMSSQLERMSFILTRAAEVRTRTKGTEVVKSAQLTALTTPPRSTPTSAPPPTSH
ncbi:hypothetical protein RKE25_10765 [Dyella sp. BiH032]|uniref:hypothetical protein n=1 Tax=Dyella sp. BiH032 TaxID=3075430 RepID=UPI002893404F|nr:hypothetical protein [Dyella sp. BiH032]WNL48073.1 hypothetical protein RKE25_10765 [Dyella sp. BiH032]